MVVRTDEVAVQRCPSVALELPCTLLVAERAIASVSLKQLNQGLAGPLEELEADVSIVALGDVWKCFHDCGGFVLENDENWYISF